MYLFRFTIPLFSIFAISSCTSSKGQSNVFNFAEQKMFIISNGDQNSAAMADYFNQHLSKRNTENKLSIIRTDSPDTTEKTNQLYFELVPDLSFDYEIKNVPGKLSLFAKNRETMIWLIYGLISQFGEKGDIDVHDLPPAIINFRTGQFNFAMHYREPHLLSNTDPDLVGIYHTNSVDRDWGIWGHNFKKIFDGKIPERAYAQTEKGINKDQFCFSSAETLAAIKAYLAGQEGNGVKYFMIAPNDNNIACTCETCKELIYNDIDNFKIVMKNLEINYSAIKECTKIALIGSGMRGVPGVIARILKVLFKENIKVLQTADSHTTIWCLVESRAAVC